jgi:hypothetical protein
VSSSRLGLIRAAATLVAVVASFVTVYALCLRAGAQIGPAVLAAVLAMTFSRGERPSARRAFVAPLVIAGTALAAGGVGWLLLSYPIVGAIVFVASMFASIWLRNFGERGRAIGALIATPLVAMLVVPARADAPGGWHVDLALIVCAGIVPLAYVSAVQALANRAGMPLFARASVVTADVAPRKVAGFTVPTRMALQMTVALAAAFVAGFALFPGHWGWSVLTAFIVCSGARGRGDAAYKGVLRLIGAVIGTLAAAALAYAWVPSGIAEACVIFAVLFVGLWLRDVNYAYWACCVTLILAFLTRSGDSLNVALLAARLEAILAGAVCAVAAAWFVLPIRTQDVIRRRLADALAALDDVVANAHLPAAERAAQIATFEHRMGELDEVAHPATWHRRIFAFADQPEHPARWVQHARDVRTGAYAFVERPDTRSRQRTLRAAIGASRRAIGNHGKPDASPDAPTIGSALRALHDELTR